MPICYSLIAVGETARRYKWPVCADSTPSSLSCLLAEKKKASQNRDEFLKYQKAAEKERDFDTARFFREEAAAQLKIYRAATFLLPWYTNEPPGDCRMMQPSEWPIELASQLDYLTGLADAA